MVNLKFSKTTAFFTAAFMASAPFSTICAADANTIQIPVYEEFNQNDVNGQVIIDLPEGVTAHVDITFDSPEGKDIPYYSSDIEGSSESAIFKIEGRDTTDDDYRNYNLTISMTAGKYSRKGKISDSFTIYDPNDNPKSFTNRQYTITADEDYSAVSAELTNENSFGGVDGDYAYIKEYTFHMGLMMGDVNGDGIITGSDATMTLMEYTLISSGAYGEEVKGTFDDYQKAAADTDHNGIITGSDATQILYWYTRLSSGLTI